MKSNAALRSELENMQLHADRIVDESLESTRRMVGLVDESQETGTKTLKMLDEQGNQLNKVEREMEGINKGVKQAEKDLEGLEKCCGLCVCPCHRSKNFEKEEAYKKAWSPRSKKKVVKNQPQRKIYEPRKQDLVSQRYVERIQGDAREDEMEENLKHVGGAVGNLKNMAVDMKGELDKQNTQLERINIKAGVNEQRVARTNERAQKIFRYR